MSRTGSVDAASYTETGFISCRLALNRFPGAFRINYDNVQVCSVSAPVQTALVNNAFLMEMI